MNADLPEWSKELIAKYGTAPVDIPDRWMVHTVLGDLDIELQIAAAKDLLNRNAAADQELDAEMERINAFAKSVSGIRNYQATEEYGERFYQGIYQSAAHSMAAVGMLAPLIESLFHHAFIGIGKQFAIDQDALKKARRATAGKKVWDCHLVKRKDKWGPGLVQGIAELAKATGLQTHLPNDYKMTLEALFAYRGKMFHCGFEWPKAERVLFSKWRKKKGWPESWFDDATTGGDIWIHYMTSEFVDHCLAMIDGTVEGLGKFCRICVDQEMQK